MCWGGVVVESLLLFVLLLFSVCGICEVVYIFSLLFSHPKIRTENYSFFVLRSGYAIKQLNYIWQKIKWDGDKFAVGIIAICDDIDDDELLECKNFSKNKNIILCTTRSFSKLICIKGSK